jgi:hypothetical protein
MHHTHAGDAWFCCTVCACTTRVLEMQTIVSKDAIQLKQVNTA